MLFDAPVTMTDALAHQLAKQVMPTSWSSYQLEQLAREIRDRSFFSARTTYADYLADTQQMIQKLVAPNVVIDEQTGELRAAQAGERMNPALMRTRMQQMLRQLDYQPAEGEKGGLKDLSSDQRVDLIIDTQTKMSAGYGKWAASQDQDVMDLYPADEMYRQGARLHHREWADIWNEARAALGDSTTSSEAVDDDEGPFIALKNDPIWAEISRWGDPFPPFDYNSGMWVRDADPDEAEALGVKGTPQPQQRDFNASVEVDVPADMDGTMVDELMASLGDRAELSHDGTRITLKAAPARSGGAA